jgi:hypothetical protein
LVCMLHCMIMSFLFTEGLQFSFLKTIPDPLRQLSAKNLIISKAPLKSTFFKMLYYYTE